MVRRRLMVAMATVLAWSMVTVAPAGAGTGSFDDPGGDVTSDSTGAAVDDPRLDIERVTVRNEGSLVEVRVEVAEAVALSSDDWKSELVIMALLGSPDTTGLSAILLLPTTSGGQAFSGPGWCDATASADTAADAYVLRVTGDCARAVPAVTFPLVLATNSDGAPDFGPDPSGEGEIIPVDSGVAAAVNRLAGTDRTLTAVQLSADRRDAGKAGAVVLASSTSFPDALAGGPLASVAGAPILLTGQGGLDARTRDEIRRVLPAGRTVYLLGGTAVLGDQVVNDVRAAGFTPERVAGTNRFETAVAIAREYDAVLKEQYGHIDISDFEDVTLDVERHSEVFIADGRSFTDGLIAGAAGSYGNGVVVLTEGATMPAATKAYLDADESAHYAIGSNAGAAAPTAEPISGTSPSHLSRQVAEQLASPGGIVAVATESAFADALAGGAHIGSLGGPLLLTNGQALSPDVRAVIEDSAPALREVVVYGGTAAVSDAVVNEIRQALG